MQKRISVFFFLLLVRIFGIKIGLAQINIIVSCSICIADSLKSVGIETECFGDHSDTNKRNNWLDLNLYVECLKWCLK